MIPKDVSSEFRAAKLGLSDNDIRLVAHQHEWSIVAKSEIARIRAATNELFEDIDHIGSTAVRKISAKPILDFVAAVENLELIEERSSEIEGIGYVNRGEFGIKERRFLTLSDVDGTGFVHLHVFAKGDARIREHQIFRDFLNAKVEAREAYEDLKQRIAKDPNNRRSHYSALKADGLNQLLRDAKLWSESIL